MYYSKVMVFTVVYRPYISVFVQQIEECRQQTVTEPKQANYL